MPKNKNKDKNEKKYKYPKDSEEKKEKKKNTKEKSKEKLKKKTDKSEKAENKYGKRNWNQYLEKGGTDKIYEIKKNKTEYDTNNTKLFNQNDKIDDDIKSQKNNLIENNNEGDKRGYDIKLEYKNEEGKKENKNSDSNFESQKAISDDENKDETNWKKLFEDNFNDILQEEEPVKSDGILEEEEVEEDSEIIEDKNQKKEQTTTLTKSIDSNNICKVNNISYENINFKLNMDNYNNKDITDKLEIEKNYFTLYKDNDIKNIDKFSSRLSNKENNKTKINKEIKNKVNKKDILNLNQKVKNYIDEKNIIYNNEDSIIFNGKEFKYFDKVNNYKPKDNISRIVYKCINYRKFEKFRIGIKNSTFCNATIIYILPNQNKKSGYFFKKDHSEECKNITKDSNIYNKQYAENKKLNKKIFIEECEKIMNRSSIYDRTLFKEQFKDIYNQNKYDFEINNNLLSNIITKWKEKSNRFNKFCVLENPNDYENRQFLREFRNIYVEVPNKKEPVLLDYIIWANNENISRIRISHYLFLDGTFHHPKEYKQLLVLMFNDIITNINIPGLFILLNGKYEKFYEIVFQSMLNIITQNREYELKAKVIVTDSESALRNSLKKIIPNVMYITCFFHYTQDILRNIRSYGLYKKEQKNKSDMIIKYLASIPLNYDGDMNYVETKLQNIINENPLYENFINNYFKKNKLQFFEDRSLNYHNIPREFRTNNFLENYNGFIKSQLGKKEL